ncbi:hypothetical protein [Lentzea sp. CC55]|uniref:hypothetical protein n=1 Tax=Lentzea sp. CC55 TaxID=2884909 RepID=UPI001F3A5FF0|nr:hypothetical protein [Lentzea sp. CC55]MCG8925148.1 hypothetical protein [Lentzea sp. CC55]
MRKLLAVAVLLGAADVYGVGQVTQAEHNAVSGADLVGLAHLGDWVPLLTSEDEALVLAAAGNALKRWAPGPSTPRDLYGVAPPPAGWTTPFVTTT